MNNIYRIIWNAATGTWVVASEFAKGRKKASTRSAGLSVAVGGLLLAGGMFALADSAHAQNYNVGTGSAVGANSNVGTSVWNNPLVVPSTTFYNTAVGNSTLAGRGSVAFGDHAIAAAFFGTAVGTYSSAGGDYSTAVGGGAMTTAANSTALGYQALASGAHSMAQGNRALASGEGSIAQGSLAQALNINDISIGRNAGKDAIVSASNGFNVSIGANAGESINGRDNVALGTGAAKAAVGSRNVSIGQDAGEGVTANDTVSLGSSSTATANSAVAIGNAATASAANSVALGAGSTTTANLATAAYNPGSTAVAGMASIANGEVSVGKAGGERRVTNVAAGAAATDAVNVSQLRSESDKSNAMGAATAAAIGGGAAYNAATGAISAPSYEVGGASFTNMGAALLNIDGRTSQNTDAIALTDEQVAKNAADIGDVDSRVTSVDTRVTGVDSRVTTVNDRVTSLGDRVGSIEGDLNSGAIGLVKQHAVTRVVTVAADKGGASVNVAGTDGDRVVSGVAVGVASNDAVNLSQLELTNEQVAKNAADIGDVDDRITSVDNRIDGVDSRVTTVNDRVTNVDSRVTTVNDRVTSIGDRVGTIEGDLSSGVIGLVKQDAVTRVVTVAADKGGASVNVAGTDGDRVVSGVAAGVADNDAVNVRQLKASGLIADDGSVLDAIAYDAASSRGQVTFAGANGTVLANVAEGKIEADSKEAVNGGQLHLTNEQVAQNAADIGDVDSRVTTVNDRVTSVDNRVTTVNDRVTSIGDRVGSIEGDLSSGVIGLVRQDAVTRVVTVAADKGGTSVNLAGTDGDRVVGGVAAGVADNDAVNISQLNLTNEQVAKNAADIGDVDNRVTAVDNRVTNIDDRVGSIEVDLNSGVIGLVRQDATSRDITVAADSDGTRVSMAGTAGDRVVSGVAAGVAGNDAVNVSQLTAAGLIAEDGTALNALVYDSNEKDSITLGGKKASKAVKIANVADATEDDEAVNLRQLKQSGLIGENGQTLDAVVYDANSSRAQITFAGANGTVLANVADGRIASGSRDAVNGGQIAALRDSLQGQITGIDSRVAGIEENGAPGKVPAQPVNNSIAAGGQATADGEQAVAIGDGANASADNSVALGAGSVADRANTVSVGSPGYERQITNVAPGVRDTDAVNVSQLNDRMVQANAYTDQRIDDVWTGMNDRLDHVNRQANRGIAGAAALIPVTPYIPGTTALNAGIASYRGEGALGVGVSRWTNNGRVNLNAGVSAAQGDSPIFRVGVGVLIGN